MKYLIASVCLVIALTGCRQAEVAKPEVDPIRAQFPDYKPKTSPDTMWDYRPMLASTLNALPAETLEALPELLKALEQAKQVAEKSPGRWTQGQIPLGADPKQYEPSDAELRVAAIGDRARRVVASADPAELLAALKEAGIEAKEVVYNRFTFRHADVMGSGRFTYASEPIPTTIALGAK